MARARPTVWVTRWGRETRAEVQLPSGPEPDIRLDTLAWLSWLEAPTTSSFAYPVYDPQAGYIRGFMTVRKEKRRRGSHYWVAYRRTGRRLRKIYLGKSAELSQRDLAATAERFLAMDEQTADGQKEVIAGQRSGASLEREAMMRRLKSSHRVVHLGRPWVALYGRRWWHIHGRLLTQMCDIDTYPDPLELLRRSHRRTAASKSVKYDITFIT